MIVATDRCRTVPLLPFLQTLFDIALLRKGPEHIPRSVVMLVMAIVFWLLVRLAMLVFDEGFDEYSFIIELFSAFLAAVCYSAVIIISGQRPRLLQSLSAIIGISALMRVMFLSAKMLLQSVAGVEFMWLVAWATILWSVSVKGHIIASAIGCHRYVGLAIAVAVLILQLFFEISMVPES